MWPKISIASECVIVSLFNVALFAAPLLYNSWVVGFAKLVVQTVAVVLDSTPAVKPYRVAMTAILGVSVESNPVHPSSLLCKRQQMCLAI
jgi:hypothetical protein